VTSNDHDRVMRLIRARCVDVLTDADLALLGDAAPDPDALPASIGAQILEVVERMADRLDAFERRLAVRAA
jgi:hypothetical protein